MKYGCCINLCDIDAAAEIGFDFVDLHGAQLAGCGDAEAVAGRLERSGLSCYGLHASVPPDIRLAGDDYDETRVRAYFHTLGSRARRLGVRMVCIGSPRSRTLPEGFPISLADEQMARSLRAACAEMPDCTVLLESLSRSETNYINSIREAFAMVKTLAVPNLALVLDLYHFWLCGDDLSMLTPDAARSVRYLHMADPNARRYPSAATDARFIDRTRDIVRITGCGAVALEALSPDWKRDARLSLNYLHTVLD